MTNEQKWDYSLGLIQIDGLTPSDEYLELVEKEKRGEITTADMKKALDSKYKMKGDIINEVYHLGASLKDLGKK